MNDVPKTRIHLTPQEAWLQGARTVRPIDGEIGKKIFMPISYNTNEHGVGILGESTVNIDDARNLRRGGNIFIPLQQDLQYAFPIWSRIALNEGERLAMRLQEVDEEGTTIADPQFAIVKLDETRMQYIPVEDEARGGTDRITEICYKHWEEGESPIPTYREERRSLTKPEGNNSGPENLG